MHPPSTEDPLDDDGVSLGDEVTLAHAVGGRHTRDIEIVLDADRQPGKRSVLTDSNIAHRDDRV